MEGENKDSKQKKPYRKPKVKSAKYYERKALACGKDENGDPEQNCQAGFAS